jgi:hypothetical protein
MSLLQTLNGIRDQTIESHYANAVEELTQKLKASPFETEFTLSCPNKRILEEVCKRFVAGDLNATGYSGIRGSYISVTLPLPEHLQPKPVTEPVVTETA